MSWLFGYLHLEILLRVIHSWNNIKGKYNMFVIPVPFSKEHKGMLAQANPKALEYQGGEGGYRNQTNIPIPRYRKNAITKKEIVRKLYSLFTFPVGLSSQKRLIAKVIVKENISRGMVIYWIQRKQQQQQITAVAK
jgi:hypothetical protein